MGLSKDEIKKKFQQNLIAIFAEDIKDASLEHKYAALCEVVKEYIFERWVYANRHYVEDGVKQVYYFSIEFLLGRLLESNLINLGIKEVCQQALNELGIDLEQLIDVERDAGLGNGGLGRLAACFLDSMASMKIPGHGNGIRYKYGFFNQKIVNGYQVEVPDDWLRNGYVWEVRRDDKAVEVRFGGYVRFEQVNGKLRVFHEGYETVLAVPYDIPIIGYGCETVNTLRLWSAEPVDKEFDLMSFSSGDYVKAVAYKYSVEAISQVLYPDDTNEQNRILRLKQEYFFVSAGIQSILRTYKKMGKSVAELDRYIAIHVNDTHPSLVIPELMRILLDEEGLPWEQAWSITTKVVSYTNHTIMPEAMEKWPVDMFRSLLPRIYTIVEEINRRFCIQLIEEFRGDWDRVNLMSIIKDGYIRMSYLAVVGSHSVNGVSKLHTDILKNQVLSDFYSLYRHKFKSVTNGITHRRWLLKANPGLARLISETIGDTWIRDPTRLVQLKKYREDRAFQEKLSKVKMDNKIALARYIREKYGIDVDPHSVFDVQAKRLHAYKRQLLNALHIMYLYNTLKENPSMDVVPRTFVFSAKAAPGYYLAKKIIKLINAIAAMVNSDRTIKDKIKVVFMENYGVSLAEKIIPCADVSEQISTASKEASGTGNMKFMMNGAITLGTLDGANVEIKEAVGDDNIVIFGLTVDEVLKYYKNGGYSSRELYMSDPRIKTLVDQLIDGFFAVPQGEFVEIYDHLIKDNDEFFVLKDFDSYTRAHQRIDGLFKDRKRWLSMAVVNIACSGMFSSDGSVRRYADEIWGI